MEKKANKKGQNAEILQTRDSVQAVILADSFDSKFKPITQDVPRVGFHLDPTDYVHMLMDVLGIDPCCQHWIVTLHHRVSCIIGYPI